MAERRMFTQKIVDSDAFLEMPLSTQSLYFHLNMRADDDGFVNNPRKICRVIGAAEDDLKLLIAKRFILAFESGVIVIKHWRMHNLLRKDRYKQTDYQEERNLLALKPNGSYTENVENFPLLSDWQPNGNQMATQVSIGKDSIGKDRLGKDRLGKDRLGEDRIDNYTVSNETVCRTDVQHILDEWNTLSAYGIAQISRVSQESKRYKGLIARIKEYDVDSILKAIDNIRHSNFLQGKNNKQWVITFDWFVLPNNFPKVLEGNYSDRGGTSNSRLDVVDTWV